jgi:hypothetical protein
MWLNRHEISQEKVLLMQDGEPDSLIRERQDIEEFSRNGQASLVKGLHFSEVNGHSPQQMKNTKENLAGIQ